MTNNNDIVIEPEKKAKNYWKEIWQYRELFYFLAWRDISVRYKQTAIGVIWILIKPVLTMVILTVIFGILAGFPSSGVPYPILVYSALLPWSFISGCLSETSNSIVTHAGMITKIYFPRIIIPISVIIVNLVDFAVTFTILIGLMIWFQFIPSWAIIAIPLFLLLASIVSLGAGILIAALNVKYRDFSYIVPFIIQFGLYLSPVGFGSNIIPDAWRLLFSINPVVGIIDGFRWAILGQELNVPSFLISTLVGIVLLIFGWWYFHKVEDTFADII